MELAGLVGRCDDGTLNGCNKDQVDGQVFTGRPENDRKTK
jgi:hypothetical protein